MNYQTTKNKKSKQKTHILEKLVVVTIILSDKVEIVSLSFFLTGFSFNIPVHAVDEEDANAWFLFEPSDVIVVELLEGGFIYSVAKREIYV